MVYRWNVPDEIVKGVNVSSLPNDNLLFYHAQMHVFWEKLIEGRYFGQSSDDGWTFEDVDSAHKEIVIEILKRGLKHVQPINSLDYTSFAKNTKELISILNSIKK